MAFDSDKFMKTKFKDRTDEVKVPELAGFFEKGEPTVWVVKALTGSEIAQANNEVIKNTDLAALVTSLMSSAAKEKAEAVKDLIGVQTDKVPNEIVKRISHLMSGSVSPACSREMAVKIGENYGVVFYKLTNKILELSGDGRLGE